MNVSKDGTPDPRGKPSVRKELRLPKAGDVVRLGRAASVQFADPIMFRVIRVLDWPTYDHWIWLDGYQLDTKGDAIARRSVYVQKNGLKIMRLGLGLSHNVEPPTLRLRKPD